MKSKVYYAVFLCIVVIVNGVAFIYQQKTISRLKKMPLEAENKRVENILLKEGFFHTYDFENISIDYSVSVYNITDGNTKRLEDMFSGKNSIVLFMSVGSCNCWYDNIKAIQDIRKKSNVVIGIDGLTMREFKSFVSQNNIKEIAYLLPDGIFEGFKINPVVYFVVDKNLNSKYFYAPSIAFPDLTKIYLDKIKNMVDLNK
jgi:hypothetical protein